MWPVIPAHNHYYSYIRIHDVYESSSTVALCIGSFALSSVDVYIPYTQRHIHICISFLS